MRIAIVCPYSCTVPGGVQTQVLGLARALRSRGDDVAVLAPAQGTPSSAALGPAALGGALFVKVGEGTTVSVNGSRAPVSPWPWTMSRTVSALREFAPEIVHVHEPFAPGPSLGAVMLGPRPIVGTFHRSGADFAYRTYGHVVGAWSRRLDAAFAVSEAAGATAKACVGRLSQRVAIIPNGVEVEKFARAPRWPTSEPTIVFVGRHEPRKGLKVLLEAFRLLPGSMRLWVVGDGPETGALRAQFAHDTRIEWLGPLGDEERAARLAGAEVFVAPSLRGESFGVVLLEAMAAGTAVVASDIAGYQLAAGSAARLVAPGDPVALARTIRDVLDDEGEREALRSRGRQRAAEYDMGVIAGLYRDSYLRLGRAPGAG
ncbi:MAG: glycosyltransferase family 4 protein [Acidimicrobiales bacterium]